MPRHNRQTRRHGKVRDFDANGVAARREQERARKRARLVNAQRHPRRDISKAV